MQYSLHIMPVIPISLLDLQLDFVIVPFDTKISAKFDKKLRELLVPKIDLQPFITQVSELKNLPPRCSIFIRPHSSITPSQLYQQAIKALQDRKFPHLEISESAFDKLLDSAQLASFRHFEASAQLQGLDGKQVEAHVRQAVSQAQFRATTSNETKICQPEAKSAQIQVFLMAVQDAAHRFAPKFSDQLKAEKGIPLSMVVPCSFIQGSNYYSPVQILPLPCDDPTNPHFYVNDCRPAHVYGESMVQLPVPRLIINGFQLLPFSENIIKKNEELTKTAQDLAWVYGQIENTLFVAVHALSQILSNGIVHVQYVSKLIQEQIQLIKSGAVTKIDYQPFDFFFSPEKGQYQQIQNLDSFEEPYLNIMEISKNKLDSIQKFVQQTISIYQSSVEAITMGYCPDIRFDPDKSQLTLPLTDIQYLEKSLKIEQAEVEFTVYNFIKRLLDNASTDPRFIMDSDEMGSVLASNLRLILYKQFLSGYYNYLLSPNQELYDYIKVQIKYMSPLDRYRIDSREFKYHYQRKYQQFVESNYTDKKSFSISLKSILYVFAILDDPIAIRPANQPELKDSVFLIQKNAVHYTTYEIIQIFTQLLRINKKIRDRPTSQTQQKQQYNQYYVLNEEDNEDENESGILQNQRVTEDTTNGKCAICSSMYSNYKDHIQTKQHKEKYLQALKHENLLDPLIKVSKQFETKNQVKNQMSTICQLLSQRTNVDFSYTAHQINQVLKSINGDDFLVDIDDVPRSNSPSCRTEQFGKWRETVLKERFNNFEQILVDKQQKSSNSIELDSTTISCAWKIYESAQLEQNLKDALISIIKQYGGDEDVKEIQEKQFTVQEVVNQQIASQEDVQRVQFTGLNDIIDHNDLYAELTKVTSQFKKQQSQNDKESPSYDSMSSMTKDEFLVFQDYTKQQLSLILSPKIELKFEELFFKFSEGLKTDKQIVADNSLNIKAIKDVIDKYETNMQIIQRDGINLIDDKITNINNSPIKDLISQEVKNDFIQPTLILPPLYVKNENKSSTVQELLKKTQELDIQNQNNQPFQLHKKTSIQKLTQICVDHYSDLQIINDFFDTEVDTFDFDYEIQDDSKLNYVPKLLDQNQDELDFPKIQHMTRCNTIPGPIMLFKYHLTPKLAESDVLNSVIISQLPKDNPSRLLQQGPNISDDQDFSQTLTQQPTLQPNIQPSLINSSPWNEIVQNFDFTGQFPTFENTSLSALQAACALIVTQTGPTALTGASAFAFDAITAGVVASQEGGVDPGQLSVIYAAGAARVAQDKEYDEATINSRTVQRRILGSGIF